jgi:hypothetical protein
VFRKAQCWMRRRPWTLAAAAALLVMVMACVIYGLVEQTRFLRAQHVNPGIVRAPGHHTTAMRSLNLGSAFVFLVVLWTSLLMQKFSRRLASWSQLFDPRMHWLPRHAVPFGLAAAAGMIALAALASGVFVLGRVISAFVWDGTVGWSDLVLLYAIFWFGFSLLVTAGRSLFGYARSLPVLSADALVQVESDIREGELGGAIQHIRAAAPGTSFEAARETVETIAARLEADAPGTLVTPNIRRRFNLPAVLLCVAVELLILLLLWKSVPSRHSVPFLLEFAAQFALGVCMMLSIRMKGFARRFAAIFVALMAMIAVQEFLKPQYSDFNFYAGLHLVGLIFGIVLVASAWSRWRRLPRVKI